MKPSIVLLLAAGALAAAQTGDVAKELDRVAQTATVMMDGDVCQRIQTKRSVEFTFKHDPKDPYLASDNYDVDHELFVRTKKTLIRLARLCPLACDANLWMPVPSDPTRIQVMIRNVYEMSSFWQWGQMYQPTPVEMKHVMEKGERVTVQRRDGKISVLAPVYNSLDDIVGLVEVVAQQRRDLQENVK